MLNNKNITYYIIAVLIFILLKLAFEYTTNEDLIFLLKPTDQLIKIIFDSPSVFLKNNGYFHEDLNIIIGKSCSGFNFMLICFLALVLLSVKYFKEHLHKILVFPASMILAYFICIFTNTSRIFVSILIQDHICNIFNIKHGMVHEIIGLTINLSFLIFIYLLIRKLLIKYTANEKLT